MIWQRSKQVKKLILQISQRKSSICDRLIALSSLLISKTIGWSYLKLSLSAKITIDSTPCNLLGVQSRTKRHWWKNSRDFENAGVLIPKHNLNAGSSILAVHLVLDTKNSSNHMHVHTIATATNMTRLHSAGIRKIIFAGNAFAHKWSVNALCSVHDVANWRCKHWKRSANEYSTNNT